MTTQNITKQQELLVIRTLKVACVFWHIKQIVKHIGWYRYSFLPGYVIQARDHYEVLQVGRSASREQVKKAFRDLALQLHPDKNTATGSEDAFKVATAAYNCLSDPAKRSVYDRWALGQAPTFASQSSRSSSRTTTAVPTAPKGTKSSFNPRNYCKDVMLRCCCIVDGPDGKKKFSWPLCLVDSAPLVILGMLILI
mmetsp:Transcript_18037/g.46230  ORF Transcript_18037/g.46230 Transcript_18037/m.46230 type:complete len:196 (+) Transcript_18037:345-932(+)